MARSRATINDSSASSNLYDALAPIYDVWQASGGMTPFALVTEARLAPRLERASRGGALSFLDLGCGTGMLLSALRAGHPRWRLAGVDGSAGMLAVAARTPGAETITWARAALDDRLPFAHRFDAAGAFHDTLNHLPDAGALHVACTRVAQVLRPGGLFVFDVTNRLGFERWWNGTRRFTAAHWRITIDAGFDRDIARADVAVERDDQPERRFQLHERLFDDEHIVSALRGAGLTVEGPEPWCPFEMDVPGKTWWTAILPNR